MLMLSGASKVSLIDDEEVGEPPADPDKLFYIRIESSPGYNVTSKPICTVAIQDADHRSRFPSTPARRLLEAAGRWCVHDMVESLLFKSCMLFFTIYALFGTDLVSQSQPACFMSSVLCAQWAITIDYDQDLDKIELVLIFASIVAFCTEIVCMWLVEGNI